LLQARDRSGAAQGHYERRGTKCRDKPFSMTFRVGGEGSKDAAKIRVVVEGAGVRGARVPREDVLNDVVHRVWLSQPKSLQERKRRLRGAHRAAHGWETGFGRAWQERGGSTIVLSPYVSPVSKTNYWHAGDPCA